MRRDICLLSAVLLFAAVLLGFRLGAVGLLDPDEPFYALSAKEMLERGDWSTPVQFGKPQFEKPIFFYWALCAFFKIFGVNEFSARLASVLPALLTLAVTYAWARVLFGRRDIAFLSTLILATSVEFIILGRVVLTDMWLCFFVTAAFFCFSLGYRYLRFRKAAWTLVFFFSALGFLTKGPLSVFFPFAGIACYLLLSGQGLLLKEFPWRWGLSVFALVAVPWYALMTAQHGADFLKHFFIHENIRRFFVAEHKKFDRLLFYPASILVGFFPWSALIPGAVWHGVRKIAASGSRARGAFLFLGVSFLVPFIFFSAAKSKLFSYLFPAHPVMAIALGAWGVLVWRSLRLGASLRKGLLILAVLTLGVFPAGVWAFSTLFDASKSLGFSRDILLTACGFIPFFWVSVYFVLRGRFRRALPFVLAGVLFSSSLIFGFLMPKAEAAFSSRPAARWFEANAAPGDTGLLLSSKLFVRGAAFYTGRQEMGVLSESKKIFYTAPPVPVLSSREELAGLDGEQFPVYCFLRSKEVRFLQGILKKPLTMTVVKKDAQRSIVRIDRDG